MKKLLLLLLILTIGLTSCETELDVKSDLQRLKIERADLNGVTRGQRAMIGQQQITIESLSNQIKTLRIEMDMIKQGKEPKYILKLKLKQSHISLDPFKHMKDASNAIKFELSVDKEFYDSVKIGTAIVDEFRVGSAVFDGSFGSWEMTVINKRLK